MSEPLLSADQTGSHLGVAEDTMYSWIADKGMGASWMAVEGTKAGALADA